MYKGEESYKNFTSKNWEKLNTTEKQLAALRAMEKHMAKQQGRKARAVENDESIKADGTYSYGNPTVLKINLSRIDANFDKSGIENLKGTSGYATLDAVIHEGIHAHQLDAVNKKKGLKNNDYDKATLEAMGQDFLYKGDSNISRPLESKAYEKTLDELQKIREKITGEELKKIDAYLDDRKKFMEELKNKDIVHHEVKTFEEAQQKALESVNKSFEQIKGNSEHQLATIKQLENERTKLYAELAELKAERKKMGTLESKKEINQKIKSKKEDIVGKTADINVEIDRFKSPIHPYPYSHQELLRQIKALERGEGLTVQGKGGDDFLSHAAKSPSEPTKEPRMTDKKRVAAVIEAQKGLDMIERRLSDPKLEMTERKKIEADKIKQEREHSEAIGEILKRPNSYQLIGKIENAQRAGRIRREKGQEKEPDSSRDR